MGHLPAIFKYVAYFIDSSTGALHQTKYIFLSTICFYLQMRNNQGLEGWWMLFPSPWLKFTSFLSSDAANVLHTEPPPPEGKVFHLPAPWRGNMQGLAILLLIFHWLICPFSSNTCKSFMNYKFADDKVHHETVCEVHEAVSTTGPTSPWHPLHGPTKPTAR